MKNVCGTYYEKLEKKIHPLHRFHPIAILAFQSGPLNLASQSGPLNLDLSIWTYQSGHLNLASQSRPLNLDLSILSIK